MITAELESGRDGLGWSVPIELSVVNVWHGPGLAHDQGRGSDYTSLSGIVHDIPTTGQHVRP